MNALSQSANLPGFFRIGHGVTADVGKILSSLELNASNIAILSGPHFSCRVAQELAAGLPASTTVTFLEVTEGSEDSVATAGAACRAAHSTLLLSIGGGKVIDVGKRIHKLFGLTNIAIPTIISNDGLISPISVLKDAQGNGNSLPASVPAGVIVDLDIIAKSPKRYLLAAAGDVLSNMSASGDWKRLFIKTNGEMAFNDLAYELALGAAEALVMSRSTDFGDDFFLTSVIRAQVYSGLAMSLAGTSRPCSGAEHLLSHAIDHLHLADGELHGIQVGSISLFALSLFSDRVGVAVDFARRIGLPLDWRHLTPKIAASLPAIIETARLMRPDRRTILDDFSNGRLLSQAEQFGAGVVMSVVP